MRHLNYILDHERRPVPCNDLQRWGEFMEDINNRRVAITVITDKVHVSTVFIGLNHRFTGDGPPILFETMIFGGPDQVQWRYSSWDDAETGHAAAVRITRAALEMDAARRKQLAQKLGVDLK
jgi:hypothetical protein